MRQDIPFRQFTRALCDDEREADQTAQILQAILEARSPRLSDSATCPGQPAADDPPPQPKSRQRDSGLFLVLKAKPTLSLHTRRALAAHALAAFLTALAPPVPSLVPTSGQSD